MARRTVSRLTSCSWVSVDSDGSGSSRASSPDSILRRKISASCTYSGSSAYLSIVSPGTNLNVANVDHVPGEAYVCLVGKVANIGNIRYSQGMADTSRHPESAPADNTKIGQVVGVALTLLEQHWPSCPALEDSIDSRAPGLERDPRYLIGRLQQALTVLLEQDLSPMDTQTALLSQAIGDALAWRTHEGRPCVACDQSEDLCDGCAANWAQADRYHELARAMGAVENWPTIARICGNT